MLYKTLICVLFSCKSVFCSQDLSREPNMGRRDGSFSLHHILRYSGFKGETAPKAATAEMYLKCQNCAVQCSSHMWLLIV